MSKEQKAHDLALFTLKMVYDMSNKDKPDFNEDMSDVVIGITDEYERMYDYFFERF